MTSRARLTETHVPARPTGVVLVLHGGAARPGGAVPVSPTQLSVLRMIPVAARVARSGRGRLAVLRLLNSTRGWDRDHSPVDDVAWALRELRDRLGADLPACLVGHSLGGRAALLAAQDPQVRSVVALNPWLYGSEGEHDLSGRRVLVVHGDQDRVASPERSSVVAGGLRRTAQVGYVRVAGGKHAMLRHGRIFERLAAEFAAATLLGAAAGRADGPVGRVLGGEQLIDL